MQIPHVRGKTPSWIDDKWSISTEEILNLSYLDLCSQSIFINPVEWMKPFIKQTVRGNLECPNCLKKVGNYNWTSGLMFTCYKISRNIM